MHRSTRYALGAIAALLTLPSSANAQGNTMSKGSGHADASVAFRFGTLGFGLELSKLLISHLGVRVGANYFKTTTTKAQSNISYNATAKLQAVSALVDLFPSSRGSFHITGGIMTDPAKVTAIGQPTGSDTYTINNHTYTAAEVGTLNAEAKFPGVGPYLGIGFGTPARNHGALKFLFDLGAVIGKATVALNATGAAADPLLAADLKAQQDKTQADVQKYAKVYPVVSFGIAYAF